MNNFESIIKLSEIELSKKLVVVCAEEEEVLKSVHKAIKNDIITKPILIGDKDKIISLLQKNNFNQDLFKIINITDSIEACTNAVELIIQKEADFLMKGLVDTSIILKAILNQRKRISSTHEVFFSHITVAKLPTIDHLLLISDAAMSISPTVQEKIEIIKNAVHVAHKLGIEIPKVALIAAKEKVSKNMIATQDAAEITQIYAESEDCIVEGPLALDNAISPRSALIKGLKGQIQGDADILIMPNIEAGNVLYKSLQYFSNDHQMAGILYGGAIPIIITSRADKEETKFYSIALASII